MRAGMDAESRDRLLERLRGSRWYAAFYRGVGGTEADTVQMLTDACASRNLALQPSADIDELYRMAHAAEAEFVRRLERLGMPFSRTHMFKRRERFVEKLKEYADRSPANILDVLRTRIVLKTMSEVPAAIDRIMDSFDVVSVIETPLKSPYRAINVKVRMSTGFIAEIQVTDACYAKESVSEHKDYEVRRTGGKGTGIDYYAACRK